jgi:hypothetical protein
LLVLAVSAHAEPAEDRALFDRLAKLRKVTNGKPPKVLVAKAPLLEREFRRQFRHVVSPQRHIPTLLRVRSADDPSAIRPPAGGYSAGGHTVYVSDQLAEADRDGLVAHEMTHAVQRFYGLSQDYADPTRYGFDGALARTALVEGDAKAMERELQPNAAWGPWHEDGHFRQQEAWRRSRGGYTNYYRRLRTFPYSEGLRFVAYLYRNGGIGSIKKAFRSPPESTEQVLFPAKYQLNDRPLPIEARGKDDHDVTLGAFPIFAWLVHHGTPEQDAMAVVDGWGGDRFRVLSASTDEKPCGIWYTAWDTETDAAEFYAQAAKVARTAYCGASLEQADDALRCDGKDAMSVLLRRHGTVVLVLLGFDADRNQTIATSILARWNVRSRGPDHGSLPSSRREGALRESPGGR